MRRAALAAFAFVLPLPAAATPPPPPPMANLQGPATLCATGFAVRLVRGEQGQQYARDYWVVTGAGFQVGIRSDLRRLEGPADPASAPGFPPGLRQHVREYPGNAYRGWAYAFPLPDGVTLRIASDQFAGTAADNAMLRRVLIGTARNRLCIPAR